MVNSVQWLRAFAALSVVLFHARWLFDGWQRDWAEYCLFAGYAGVDIFFLISGFVMYVTTSQQTSPAQFLLKRLIRIAPMYWICTLIFYALLGFPPPIENLLANLFFMPPFYTMSHRPPFLGYAILYVGWTLNYEVWFYIIFSVSLAAKKWRVASAPFLLALPVAAGWLAAGHISLNPAKAFSFSFPYFSLISNPLLLEFPAGMALGFIYKSNFCIKPVFARLFAVLAVALFAGLFVGNHFNGHGLGRAGLPAFIMFLSLILYEKAIGIKIGAIAKAIADSSYALYLTHPIIIKHIAPHLKGAMSGMITFPAVVTACLALGLLVHKGIEIPLMRYLRQKLLPQREAQNKKEYYMQ